MDFAWEAKTPRDCNTGIMVLFPREAWDNIVYMTVLVIDESGRVVERIPLDIEEKEGWSLEDALAKFQVVVDTYRRLHAEVSREREEQDKANKRRVLRPGDGD